MFISSKTIMVNEQQAVKDAEAESVTESPTVEKTAPEVKTEAPESKPISEGKGDEVKTEGKAMGATKRIHELVDEKKRLSREVQDLKGMLGQYTEAVSYEEPQPQAVMPNYQSDVNNTGEERSMTSQELESLIANRTRLEIEKEKTINKINTEAAEALKTYPQLDKNSDSFDPELNAAVTEAVFNAVRQNPTQSVKKLTDKYMKPYLKSVESAVGEKQQELAKAAVDAALRPTGTVSKAEKSVDEMSIEEIEAKYGTVR